MIFITPKILLNLLLCFLRNFMQGNCHVNLQVFDIAGQSVKVLLTDLEQPTGRYKIPVDVSELNSGIYFYRLNVNGLTYTEKLVVAK